MKETSIKPNSRKAIKYRGVECLNCAHPLDLTDRFCSYCGQLNTTKRLTLKDFFSEFVLSVFTYDSRFRHTLKDLLFKPGTITRYYVDGKRFHYANPFRFFLSASIFYFIILGVLSFFNTDFDEEEFNSPFVNMNINNKEAIEAIDTALQDSIPEINGIPAQFNDEIRTAIEEAKKETERKKAKNAEKDSLGYKYIAQKDMDTLNGVTRFFEKFELFRDFYQATDISSTSKALDSLKYEKTRLNVWLYDKNYAIERVEKDPLRFANYMASKTPFFLFFFAPFYAIFFWLIYSKKRANYMEHLVFIFHIFSWIFVVLLISLIPDSFISNDSIVASILLTLIGPFYFYKALRNFYKQNRVITLIKFVFLNIVFLISTSIFALIFFALTAAFY
ncbi:DUF3667 domain-containing protein [uncultured Dokdonia sp.]|uniref:DUF3667 domain-containing protein n=1 Tax=uncultured Dokdonia sp. TaxID=575653 RepID=UPI002631EAE3|nr:DUF3667 domain-containing protein [uncultured Dokdonia sp.]